MDSLLDVPGLHTTSREFRARLVALANENSLNADWISAVISLESGFKPNKPNGKALGLIQFYRDYFPGIASAARMDVTWEDLYHLTATEQLPLVMAFYRLQHMTKTQRPVDYLVATFLPNQKGKPRETVLGKQGSTALLPGTRLTLGSIYAANVTYDTNGDRVITIGDLEDRINAVVKASEERLRIPVGPYVEPDLTPSASTLLWVLPFAFSAVAAVTVSLVISK